MLGKPVPDSVSPPPASIPFSFPAHRRFKHKMKFPFELLADPDEAVCERFGVPGHVQEVLNFVKAL